MNILTHSQLDLIVILKIHFINKVVIVVIISLLCSGCRPATEITGSWKNINASVAAGNINTILVTALTDRINV
jgi:hypothetical protein